MQRGGLACAAAAARRRTQTPLCILRLFSARAYAETLFLRIAQANPAFASGDMHKALADTFVQMDLEVRTLRAAIARLASVPRACKRCPSSRHHTQAPRLCSLCCGTTARICGSKRPENTLRTLWHRSGLQRASLPSPSQRRPHCQRQAITRCQGRLPSDMPIPALLRLRFPRQMLEPKAHEELARYCESDSEAKAIKNRLQSQARPSTPGSNRPTTSQNPPRSQSQHSQSHDSCTRAEPSPAFCPLRASLRPQIRAALVASGGPLAEAAGRLQALEMGQGMQLRCALYI